MTIKQIGKERNDEVIKYAEKFGIDLPKDGTLVIAESNTGKVEGLFNIRTVFMIEPFICENPLIASKLWNFIATKSTLGGVKIMRAFVKEKNIKLLEKLGFYRVFKKHMIYEINFYEK